MQKVRIFSSGVRGLPRERGGGQKVQYVPRNQGNQTFLGRDIPGFCRDIPGFCPKSLRKKKVCVQFPFPNVGRQTRSHSAKTRFPFFYSIFSAPKTDMVFSAHENWHLSAVFGCHHPVLPFLMFLGISLFFSPCEEFLVFLSVFPFFSRDFRDSVGITNPCFFGGFPCHFAGAGGIRRASSQ